MNGFKIVLVILFISLALIILMVSEDVPRRERTTGESFRIPRISFYHYFSGDLAGGIDDVVRDFQQTTENLVFEVTPVDIEAFKSLIASIRTGSDAPDLISNWAGERVAARVQEGVLAPIDELWTRAGLDSLFPPALVKAACEYDGHKYLIPITQHLVVFFYDRQFFLENSLEPPETWNELLDLARRIKQLGRIPFALGTLERWPGQFWFDYLLLRTAGPDYRQKLMTGKASYHDPEVKHVFQTWASMIREVFFNPSANSLDWSEATRMLPRGEAAMTLMGSWAIQLLEGPESGWVGGKDYDFFAFPVMVPDIKRVALGPIDGVNLTSPVRNPDAANSFLLHLTSRAAQEAMSRGSGALAPLQRIPAEFYSPIQRRLREEVNRSDTWAFNLDLATPDDVAQLVLDSFQELIAFPDQHPVILKHLGDQVPMLFDVKSRP